MGDNLQTGWYGNEVNNVRKQKNLVNNEVNNDLKCSNRSLDYHPHPEALF